MNEAEWLACDDPRRLVEGLRGIASNRKLRLYTVACCYRVWAHLKEMGRKGVLIVERFADGAATVEELARAEETVPFVAESSDDEAVWLAASADVWFAAVEAPHAAAGREVVLGWPGRNDHNAERFAQEQREEVRLLRDVFGNPFRPVAFKPAWRTSTAVAVARQMYDSREFGAMPILADALQDAGCEDETILNHCRDANQPHVRGCWVCDLVLGKE